jgi:glycosyltransferase involved in cell wall biosynthesis
MHVILTGFIPDDELVFYYNLCDCFVMPSKCEGFGMVFLEALACGKPVIAGNKDGSVDAVLDGELGVLVDPDNKDQIKDAIVDILKREVPENLLDGEYLRKRVTQAYGFDKFKERLKGIIESTPL